MKNLDILGLDNLPNDSCENCRRVFSNDGVKKYGYNKPALCRECMTKIERIDNDVADIIIADLRKQGR